MSDDDVQFDFFEEEPVTVEASLPATPGRGVPRRAPRPPRIAPRHNGPVRPIVTLGAAVACVVFVLFVFAILIASCGTSRHTSYANYVAKVQTIAAQSTTDGKQTVTALTTPGATVTKIVTTLQNVAAEEQQNVQAAESISAPGRLRQVHLHLIEALQLRVSGLEGLATAFRNTIGSKAGESAEANLLSQQAYRLLASDIVWSDLYEKPAQDQIVSDGVRQVTVPGSTFLAQPDAFVSPHAMSLVLERLSGNSGGNKTPTGLHGTNIDSVSALPNGSGGSEETLTQGQLNTVTTSSSLVFKVTIHDGGDSQEVGIPVTLTIQRPASQGGPIIKTQKVQLIDPGSSASVTFSDLGQVPFAAKTTVSVDVKAVAGETNVANNHAQYDVIFSLPQ